MYAVYDTKNKDQCIGIFETSQEVADYFGTTKQSIHEGVCRKNLREWRYEVIKFEDE